MVKYDIEGNAALAMLGNLGFIADLTLNDNNRFKDGNYLYGAFGRDFATLDDKRVMVVGLTPARSGRVCAKPPNSAKSWMKVKIWASTSTQEGDRLPGTSADCPGAGAVVQHP